MKSSAKITKITCSVKYAVGRDRAVRLCSRKPIWLITYLGPFCNHCFEDYLTTHTVDAADIARLSEDERDFASRMTRTRGAGTATATGTGACAVDRTLR